LELLRHNKEINEKKLQNNDVIVPINFFSKVIERNYWSSKACFFKSVVSLICSSCRNIQ